MPPLVVKDLTIAVVGLARDGESTDGRRKQLLPFSAENVHVIEIGGKRQITREAHQWWACLSYYFPLLRFPCFPWARGPACRG
jgi:hypothetical protein